LRLGPVTFKPRFNPYATSAEALAASFDRIRQYDSRLHSLFGAGWTLSAWARLSVLGVSGVCFYEDAGPLGWIRDEHDRDNPLYMTFALFSGTLAELGSPAEVLGMTGYDPLVLTVFRVHGPNGRLLMAVNHTNDLQTVRLNLGAKLAAAWVADEETMSGKRAAEAETGGGDGLIPHPDGSYALHLKPLSIVCLRIHDR
jgi:hypothetical protein